jgi:CelD/BcsL family acetyltransferase involved in cellulose biosynthesis
VRDPEETAKATDVLVSLHRKRADAGGPDRTNHLRSKDHRLFLREVIPALASRGGAAVALLKADDTVIGAQILLESGGTLLFYYSGFDPEWGNCSPLTILASEVVRSAIEQGVKTLNFHRFIQDWKTRLGAQPSLWFEQSVCVRGTPLSLLRTALYARDRECRDPIETDLAV